jgi:hypothetical protein
LPIKRNIDGQLAPWERALVRFMLLMVVVWAWVSACSPAPDYTPATSGSRTQAQIDAYVISMCMDSARIRAALLARVVPPLLDQ